MNDPADEPLTDIDFEELINELMNAEITNNFSDEEDKEGEEEELRGRLQRRVDDLVLKHGCSENQARQWLDEKAESPAQQTERTRQEDEELLALLDGPFKVLRDETFPDPDRLLVWDKQTQPVIQALTFKEVTTKYKCGGVGSQWSQEDLEVIEHLKRQCIADTFLAYTFHDTKIDSQDTACGTPALIISNNPLVSFSWKEVKAFPD